MGPVWEANHVWLIFVIVLLFTAFPPGFAGLWGTVFGAASVLTPFVLGMSVGAITITSRIAA